MKTKNLNPIDNYLAGSWEALGNGAPILVALAQMCSHTWTRGTPMPGMSPNHEPTTERPSDDGSGALSIATLSGEARAILFAARERGTIELKAVNTAFDAAARLLAVYVEETDERTIAFRDSQKPKSPCVSWMAFVNCVNED